MNLRSLFGTTAIVASIFGLSALAAHKADPVKGQALFASNCEFCHPAGGNSLNPQKSLKGADFVKHFPKDANIVATVRTGIPKTAMSPFTKERLSDEQLSDIIAYIRTLTPASCGTASCSAKTSTTKGKDGKSPGSKGKSGSAGKPAGR